NALGSFRDLWYDGWVSDPVAIERVHVIIVVLWMAFVLASIGILRRMPAARQRQRAGEAIVWASGALLLGLIFLQGNIPTEGILILAPAIAFITWYNVRSLKICEKCLSFNSRGGIFRTEHCRQCGSPLENTAL